MSRTRLDRRRIRELVQLFPRHICIGVHSRLCTRAVLLQPTHWAWRLEPRTYHCACLIAVGFAQEYFGVSDRRAQALIPLPPIRARRCVLVQVGAICIRSRTVFGSGWGLRPCGVCLPPLKVPVQGEQSLAVLFVAHVLQPIDDLAVELFLDGDMRHGRGRRGTVPMLLARREPNHVAGMDFLDRAALPLDPAATGRDDQGLPKRMRVPCRPAPGSNVTLAPAARAGACAWNSGSMRTVPVNQSAGPLLEGCEPLLLISI